MEIIKQNIMLECVPLRVQTQAIAEGEISPPGNMPAIASVLSIDGRTSASAQALDNAMIVEGEVTLGIIYVCNTGMVHGFDSIAPFKHTVEMKGSKAGMRCSVFPTVGEIEHKVTQGGISVRAMVALNCLQYQRCDIPVVSQIENVTLQSKTAEFSSETFSVDVAEISVKDDVRLPRPAEKLLGVSGHIRTQNVSKEGDRAIIEGVLRLSVLYLAPDGTLIQTPVVLAFTHIAQLDEDVTSVSATAKFVSLNASQIDEDIISIDSVIEITVNSRVAQTYQALSDAYSTGSKKLDCDREEILLSRNEHVDCRCSIRINASVPAGMPDVDRVLVARFRPEVQWSEAQMASVSMAGLLHGSFIYLDRDGALHGFDSVLPFESIGEAPGLKPGMDIDVFAACELIHAGASGAEIPLQVALEVSADAYYNEPVNIVKSAKESESVPTMFGPMVYFPDTDESLWDVGKKFSVSVDDLNSLNPDTSQEKPKCVLLNIQRNA